MNDYVFGLFNSANVALTADAPTSKAETALLGKVAAENDIPVDRSVIVLNPETFYTILPLVADYSVYGGREGVVDGVIPGLYGFKGFVCAPNLPEGVKGAIVYDQAVGMASRYLYPGTEGAYPETWSVTTEEGFTVGFRRFMDLCRGANKVAGDVLFGAKILQADKIVRLV